MSDFFIFSYYVFKVRFNFKLILLRWLIHYLKEKKNSTIISCFKIDVCVTLILDSIKKKS